VAERRWHGGSSYVGTTDQPGTSAGHQLSTYQSQQQPRRQLTSLVEDPSPPYSECSRFSDPTQERSSSSAHNRSITDTDKLQQRGHDHLAAVGNSYRGDGYHGDHRMPSRYSVDEPVDPVYSSLGRYPPADRSYYHGDISLSSVSSHGRRVPWTETSRSHYHSQVSITWCVVWVTEISIGVLHITWYI